MGMDVRGLKVVQHFLKRHADCREELTQLIEELRGLVFPDPLSLRARFPSVRLISDNKVTFKLRGNYFRVLATVAYRSRLVIITDIVTHKEYDRNS